MELKVSRHKRHIINYRLTSTVALYRAFWRTSNPLRRSKWPRTKASFCKFSRLKRQGPKMEPLISKACPTMPTQPQQKSLPSDSSKSLHFTPFLNWSWHCVLLYRLKLSDGVSFITSVMSDTVFNKMVRFLTKIFSANFSVKWPLNFEWRGADLVVNQVPPWISALRTDCLISPFFAASSFSWLMTFYNFQQRKMR
jgi:hypothetical protein